MKETKKLALWWAILIISGLLLLQVVQGSGGSGCLTGDASPYRCTCPGTGIYEIYRGNDKLNEALKNPNSCCYKAAHLGPAKAVNATNKTTGFVVSSMPTYDWENITITAKWVLEGDKWINVNDITNITLSENRSNSTELAGFATTGGSAQADPDLFLFIARIMDLLK